ncbi:MAG TPA: metallophosphoesterase [Longimicrobium sp.]|jgi:UDP-2,3-diacylglucosamine pyrophosphatase LpxH
MTTSPPTVIVLSDLHLGAGPLDDFDAVIEEHFCTFLSELSSSDQPTELVINGDFIDFVQAPPSEGHELEAETDRGIPLCFTEVQSNEKLSAVLNEHKKAFVALQEFVDSNPRNQLTILPGNHDPDLFWPSIQDRVRDACLGTPTAAARVRFHLGQVYRPTSAPSAWIEHGHQHDELNCFFVDGSPHWSVERPPILLDVTGTPRLLECAGTRFLIRYLNGLDHRFHFVDNVKPFRSFVQALAMSPYNWYAGPIRLIAEVWRFRRYVYATALDHPSDLLAAGESYGWLDREAADALRRRIGQLPPDAMDDFGAALIRAGINLRSSVTVFLAQDANAIVALNAIAEHPSEFDDSFGIGRAQYHPNSIQKRQPQLEDKPGTLGIGKRIVRSESETLIRAAREALQTPGVECVLMGHTHEWVTPSHEIAYANTGCWIRYLRLDEFTNFTWRDLEMPYWRYPFRLLFARIGLCPKAAMEMRVYAEGGGDQ